MQQMVSLQQLFKTEYRSYTAYQKVYHSGTILFTNILQHKLNLNRGSH